MTIDRSLLTFCDADESKVDDSILPLREMFGTCLSVVATLAKDCIEGYHLPEVNRVNKSKVLQMKLAFSLEQIISIAKLALETECFDDCKESNSTYVSTLRYCIRCLQTVLTDSNMQVYQLMVEYHS